MPDATQIAETLLRAVAEAGQQGVSGTRLRGVAIRLDPRFRPEAYGCRSLRDFIEKHAPELKIIRHKGLDPVYGYKEWAAPSSTRSQDPEYGSVDLWRVWVSPESPFILLVTNDVPVSVEAVRGTSALPLGATAIVPLEAEAHRRIAREFLERQAGAQRDVLLSVVDDPSAYWWKRWLRLLSLQPREFIDLWYRFRIERLEAALRERLAQRGVSPENVSAAAAIVSGSRKRARPQEANRPPLPAVSIERGVLPRSSDLLSTLATAVSRMPPEDLRHVVTAILRALDANHGPTR
jgi:hypothetical protein